MSINTELDGGLDVGNGFVKGIIQRPAGPEGTPRRDIIDMPSSVAVLTRPNQLPTPDREAGRFLGNDTATATATAASGTDNTDFYNELDVRISSPLVPDTHRHLFGLRSLSAGGALEEFDTVGRASKARQPLSKVIVLGLFAAKALRDHYAEHGALPQEELTVSARAALALPVNEFMRHREAYAAEFVNGGAPHLVIIENFETKVSVRITFVDVQVIAEGASAQYAINAHGEPLMTRMLDDVRSRLDRDSEQYLELEPITAGDVLAAKNTVGLDIGSGTCNQIVFSDGRFNAEASQTFDKGYGSVLESALKAMEDQGIESGFSSRNELATFLTTRPSALKRTFHARVKQFVDTEIEFYVGELAEKFGHVLRNVGAMTEVGFVFGGGSGPMKDALWPALLAKVAEMNSIGGFPVLYLDESYSRHLNRVGLFLAVQAVRSRQQAAQKNPPKSRKATMADASTT